MKIERNKTYILRNGLHAHILTTQGNGLFPVKGSVWNPNSKDRHLQYNIWKVDGRSDAFGESGFDIVDEIKGVKTYWFYHYSALVGVGRGVTEEEAHKAAIHAAELIDREVLFFLHRYTNAKVFNDQGEIVKEDGSKTASLVSPQD